MKFWQLSTLGAWVVIAPHLPFAVAQGVSLVLIGVGVVAAIVEERPRD